MTFAGFSRDIHASVEMPSPKRLGARAHRPPPWVAFAAAVAALALLGSASARAETSCYTESCATVCAPAAPVAISPLVVFSDFPVTADADTPVAFVDPGDGRTRRLVPTQEGTIWVWDGAGGGILDTPFLDLRDDVGGPVELGGERGLLSMAVEPDYTETGRFYVFYTRADLGAGTRGDVVIARYQRSAADPDLADPASATTILVLEHSSAGNHNGGQLAFGPDRFLYVSTGDGGGGCDGNLGADGDGQRPDTLHGKLLRLDVLGVDPMAGAPDCSDEPGSYGIPSSNPYSDQEAACDEVWALGLRNPFRFSFDRLTGDLYLGDVGQGEWEEINLLGASIQSTVNWGWPCREGCQSSGTASSCSTQGCLADAGTTCQFPRPASGFWDPVLCHQNPGWRSIMGGFRYRGSFVPSLAGDYLYGDAACGQIWKTTVLDPANPAAIAASCWASGFQGTYGFAEDHLGELYVVVGGQGRIDCIHNGEGCFWAGWGLFSDDLESGDLSRWKQSVPEPFE